MAEPLRITAYTDGICPSNPGPGGWGVVLLAGEHHKELSGGKDETTNNKMELWAVYKAVQAIKAYGATVLVVTDSRNVVGWLQDGWNRKDAMIKMTCWLIEQEIREKELAVTFEWVQAHAGDRWNERADELARAAVPIPEGE